MTSNFQKKTVCTCWFWFSVWQVLYAFMETHLWAISVKYFAEICLVIVHLNGLFVKFPNNTHKELLASFITTSLYISIFMELVSDLLKTVLFLFAPGSMWEEQLMLNTYHMLYISISWLRLMSWEQGRSNKNHLVDLWNSKLVHRASACKERRQWICLISEYHSSLPVISNGEIAFWKSCLIKAGMKEFLIKHGSSNHS